METPPENLLIQEHIQQCFAGRTIEYFRWTLGPMEKVLPNFRVARIAPDRASNLWAYCSIGSAVTSHAGQGRLEFILLAPHESPRCVELVTMVAHRHISDPLGKWHLLPIGQPWLEGSACDVFFISPPYPFGADLEVCNLSDDHAHLLWLLPVTQSEREYCKQHGAEALETAFEEAALEYWRIDRPAVV